MMKGITIHNTGNGLSARQLYNLIPHYLCHFLVDESEIIQTLPLDQCAEHTGKGYDFGNMHTIAIEICRSTTDMYEDAQRTAIKLIKSLMKENGFTAKDIYFHNDFNPNTYCPHRILQMYGNKQNFIKEVKL